MIVGVVELVFGEVGAALAEAVGAYRDAVTAGEFPSSDESSSIDDEVLDEVLGRSAMDQAPGITSLPLDHDL